MPEEFERWINTKEGQEFVEKNNLFYLKKEVDRSILEKKAQDLIPTSFNFHTTSRTRNTTIAFSKSAADSINRT